MIAQAQKPDFVFQRNGRVHLNRRGRQFSQLLAAEVCASAVVMLDTPRSEVVRKVLATHSIRQFPLHFPSRASPCAITFQLDSTTSNSVRGGLLFLSGKSGRRVRLTTHLHLMTMLRMSGAVPQPTLCNFMAYIGSSQFLQFTSIFTLSDCKVVFANKRTLL